MRRWGVLCAEWNGATRARGYNPQDRGSRCVKETSGQVRKGTRTGKGISTESLNTQTGQAGGLETALRALHQGNVDMEFLQETKTKQGIHTRNGTGYGI